jgi:hypothetical protein
MPASEAETSLRQVIIDFDGTLTAEEQQARPLAALSLDTLSSEIIGAPREQLAFAYEETRERLLRHPERYWWEVNGLIASYCDEGAFILNTTTLQVMLRENLRYAEAVGLYFPAAEYDPIVDCTNYLFHRHTAELPPKFRPGAVAALNALLKDPDTQPVILTNSKGDKVRRFLGSTALQGEIGILGDTRQYEMDPSWQVDFCDPALGKIQIWPLPHGRKVDLRRPAYYRALVTAAAQYGALAVVADTFSLPGALPLLMGIPFFLLCTSYTPTWCAQIVEAHPLGHTLSCLDELPKALQALGNESLIETGP